MIRSDNFRQCQAIFLYVALIFPRLSIITTVVITTTIITITHTVITIIATITSPSIKPQSQNMKDSCTNNCRLFQGCKSDQDCDEGCCAKFLLYGKCRKYLKEGAICFGRVGICEKYCCLHDTYNKDISRMMPCLFIYEPGLPGVG